MAEHAEGAAAARAGGRGPRFRDQDRRRVDAASHAAREALAEFLDVCPPWSHDGATQRFTRLQDRIDAGLAFGAVGNPVAPQVVLKRLAVGPAERRRAACPTLGVERERLFASFVAAYARPPATLDPRDVLTGPRRADLAVLPDVVEAALGPRAQVRDDAFLPDPMEVRWLLRRSMLTPRRPSTVLRDLARLTRDEQLDPLVVAALAYARIVIARPFDRGNEAAALLAVDEVLRATPGLSAARVGLATALHARRRRVRGAVIRMAHRRGDAKTSWVLAFLDALAAAARGTARRALAHRTAEAAVRDRLTGSAAKRTIGRRRVDPHELARLAAANPYLSIAGLVRAGLAGDRTAGRYLDALARLGLGRNVRWGRLRLLRLSALADAIEPLDGASEPPNRVQPTDPLRHRA